MDTYRIRSLTGVQNIVDHVYDRCFRQHNIILVIVFLSYRFPSLYYPVRYTFISVLARIVNIFLHYLLFYYQFFFFHR